MNVSGHAAPPAFVRAVALSFFCLFVVSRVAGEDTTPPDPAPAPPTFSATHSLSTKLWDDPSLGNFTAKLHKALGYATVTLGLAAIAVKLLEQDPSGKASLAHQILGESAAVGAGATLLTGALAHWDRMSFSGDLWTWDNAHALAGIVGAALMVSAGIVGPRSSLHGKLGEAGTLLMGLAIVFEQ